MYLIKKIDQSGGYVSKPGHRSSYVKNLRFARKFQTKDEAELNRCPENEIVVDLEKIFDFIRH